MLTIQDLSGNDLVTARPAAVTRSIKQGTTPITLACVITETDTNLPYRAVSADVDWNDGSAPAHYPQTSATATQASPLTLALSKNLPFGTYLIKVTARNTRATPDTVSAFFETIITASGELAPPPRYVFGPILPRDMGLPNRDTWIFDLATDNLVLESSVRMLLLTAKGERLMLPDYGTDLRQLLFAPNLEEIEGLVSQEIVRALNVHEPRVALQGLQVERRPNDRNVNVSAVFLSKLSQQPFEINLQYA
jgi:phage baseplate assembly protein W